MAEIAVNPTTEEKFELRDAQWISVGKATAEEVKRAKAAPPPSMPATPQASTVGQLIRQQLGPMLPEGIATPAATVMGGVNSALEAVGDFVGRPAHDYARPVLQSIVGPDTGATGAAMAGAIGNTAAQWFAPGAVLGGLGRGGRFIARHLPGSQAARTEIAIDKVRETIGGMSPAIGSDALFARARNMQVTDLQAASLRNELKHLIAAEKKLSAGNRDSELLAVAEPLLANLEHRGGLIDAHLLGEELSAIGARVNNLKSQGKSVHGGFAQIFKRAATDLETVPQGRALREAAEAFRREKGVEELNDILSRVETHKRGTGAADLRADQMKKELRSKEFLRESFKPEEIKDIENILQKIIEMPAIPPPAGSSFGSGLSVSGGGLVAGPMMLMGADPTAAGATGITVAALMELSRRLLPRPTGRKILKDILESGPLDQNKVNRLVAAARAISGINLPPNFMSDDPKSKQFKKDFQDAMRNADSSWREKVELGIERSKLDKISEEVY